MQWDHVIKKAKNCHSKQAWESFFDEYESLISTSNMSKPINEIYRLVAADSNFLQFGEKIWVPILSGCLSSWDLPLGNEIATAIATIPLPSIRAKVAEIYLESGQPSQARKIASRSLRLKHISDIDAITIQMIICKSYVEEGRNNMAKRMLEKLEYAVDITNLPTRIKADMLSNVARSKFFLGNYADAANLFTRAYAIYLQYERWESAASSLFNSAASYDNSGMEFQDKACQLVSECESLAEKYNLRGPLSHCYAFHGTHFHNRGVFTQAVQYYRKALQLIPQQEKSFRKLHILSMMTLTFMKAGKYKYAEKYGLETLKLAQKDESDRFKIRYMTLKSELSWQSGEIDRSYKLLENCVKPLVQNGIHTLEELATMSRYHVKSAQLNIRSELNIKVAKNLKNNNATWLEYIIALGCQHLIRKNLCEVYKLATHAVEKAKVYRFMFYEAQAYSLIAHGKLIEKAWDDKFHHALDFLHQLSESVEYKVFLVQYCFLNAARAYRQGEFDLAKKYLDDAQKTTLSPFQKQEILSTWQATIGGHSPKLHSGWQMQFIVAATKLYFAPSVKYLGNSEYLVSDSYLVSLQSYPVLDRLIQYLLGKRGFSASPDELQENVWHQSTQQMGWQQKIRNSIMRLRSLFPYTLAPLIVTMDNKIRLFHEAIEFKAKPNSHVNESEAKILTLLEKGPQSSIQLSNRIDVSQSTTKRILKKLVSSKQIHTTKVGRKVYYHGADFNRTDSQSL